MSASHRQIVSEAQRPAPESEAVRAFFDTDAYLAGNAAIAGRAILVQRLVGPTSNARILDLGCGDGSLSLPFLGRGNTVTLVDFSSRMLDRARRSVPHRYRDDVTYVHGDILGLTADAGFD